MPKPDEALQSETGVPKGYKVTPIASDYPKFVPEVRKGVFAVEQTASPTNSGTLDAGKGEYDETIGGDENLHTQYVKEGQIEATPKAFKE